ncbi:DNA gyrase subunit A [Kineosporia succinea]|uniref:DNA gyrase/topoisomerase IV subunit A n=1 Tax=Kineosporia succinea TaxID=84632 RepID=A0ABT9PES7_9ACTN|nr:DNA gyrase subunit A [Kineosporia succinea]MDP9831206.1 DNA gyrase/topoisomerase IV subunit A [Kineosporia succinea]
MNTEDIAEARSRLHILRGIEVALNHRDEVFEIVEAADDAEAAQVSLSARFDLTEDQAMALLSLQVRQWSKGMRAWWTDEIARCEKLAASDPA